MPGSKGLAAAGLILGQVLTRIASGESTWGSRSKKGRLLKNQWIWILKKNSKTTSFYCRIIRVFILFIELQQLSCFRGKICRKLESETHWWDHYPVRETKLQNFAFIGPAYWIWEPLRPFISCNSRMSPLINNSD